MSGFNQQGRHMPERLGQGMRTIARRVFSPRRALAWQPFKLPGVCRTCHGGIRLVEYCPPLEVPWPASRRILFFSDLHWTATDTHTKGEALLRLVNGAEADWVLFGGDLLRGLANLEPVLAVFARMEARRAKLAVLGNWERQHAWIGINRWREWFAEAGFTLLVNDVAPRRHAGKPEPVFIGMDDARLGHGDVASSPLPTPRPPFAVRTAHSPDGVAEAPSDTLGDLILTGHTHGGQIRLPGLGAVYTSSDYGRAFDWGWRRHTQSGTLLYTTRGIGMTGGALLRRRFLCPSEVVVINLG